MYHLAIVYTKRLYTYANASSSASSPRRTRAARRSAGSGSRTHGLGSTAPVPFAREYSTTVFFPAPRTRKSSSAAAPGDIPRVPGGSNANHASSNAVSAVTRTPGSNSIIRYIKPVAAPFESELPGTTSDADAGSRGSKSILP